jgi:hypothetical protein
MSWIKIEHDLTTSPKFVTLCLRMCNARVTVLGACVTMWMLADRHSVDDRLTGMTLDGVDSLVGLQGFGQALVDVGWLKVHDDGLEVVDYQRHNGPTVKARALTLRRVQALRMRNADVTLDRNQSVTKTKTKTETIKKKKEEAEPPTPDQIEFEFPCDGEPDSWPLTKPLVARWSELYPKLDILSECRKALAWVESNPENRKTAGGMTRFLNGWLARSSDRSPARNEIRGPSAQIRSNSSTRPMSERAAEIRARLAQAGQEIQVQIARDTIPGLGVTHG